MSTLSVAVCKSTGLKDKILQFAHNLGFQRAVIASLDPLPYDLRRYQRWLDKGYAADMAYLSRNPEACHTPLTLVNNARSALILSVSYYTPPPPSPGLFYGRVANYAVGLDYHTVIKQRLQELQVLIEKEIGRPIVARAFSDSVQLNERALAKRHGMGFKGRHTLIIGPKLMGSYNFMAELFLDLELEPDEPYQGTCGNCFRCGASCPTKAIEEPGLVNANLCISYLTIENKGAIPVVLRPKLGNWLFGCDICQTVCPYNQSPPITPWPEFKPESGAGHYLDLLALLDIKTDEEFRVRFRHTPLSRPKRKGLLRNALVVLGNCLRQSGQSIENRVVSRLEIEKAVRNIESFLERETDPLLKEHAIWALEQY